jgi:hypothetical protein
MMEGGAGRDMMRLIIMVVISAVWLGAAILLAAVVAPAAFAVLPSRTAAGALVGHVLPVVFIAGCVGALIVLAVSLAGSPGGSVRVIASIVWLAGCAIAQFVIAPRMERVRAAAGGPIDTLAADSPLRAAFGRWHGVSVALLALAIAAALVVLICAGRDVAQKG